VRVKVPGAVVELTALGTLNRKWVYMARKWTKASRAKLAGARRRDGGNGNDSCVGSALNVGHPTGARASPGSGAAICAGTSADSGILSRHQKFFCKNVFHTKATPFMGRTIFGQVFVRGGMTEISKTKVPLPGVKRAAAAFWTD
jgi:hypothetical protein